MHIERCNPVMFFILLLISDIFFIGVQFRHMFDSVPRPVVAEYIPVGIWCQNDVVSTSMRRDHVASTLIRRHFNTKCPLGIVPLSHKK